MLNRLARLALATLLLALGIAIALIALMPAPLDGARYLGLTWRDVSAMDRELILVEAKGYAYKAHQGLWTDTLQLNFSYVNGEPRVVSTTSKRRIIFFDTACAGDERSVTKDAAEHYLEVWLLGRLQLP